MRFELDKYETVEARLDRFWGEHPAGRIETRLLTPAEQLDEVVVWAGVWFDAGEPEPRATGLASERRGGQGANQTSHLENCETSSIGRALANAGYKARKDAPRPSREEMGKEDRQRPAESRGDRQATQAPPVRERVTQATEKARSYAAATTDTPDPLTAARGAYHAGITEHFGKLDDHTRHCCNAVLVAKTTPQPTRDSLPRYQHLLPVLAAHAESCPGGEMCDVLVEAIRMAAACPPVTPAPAEAKA